MMDELIFESVLSDPLSEADDEQECYSFKNSRYLKRLRGLIRDDEDSDLCEDYEDQISLSFIG